jgi:hypothetical protein
MASITAQSALALPEAFPAHPLRRDKLEFWGAYALIALAIWAPPLAQSVLSLAALAWILWATWRSFDGWAILGFRARSGQSPRFWAAIWVLPVAIALAAGAIALAAQVGTLHTPPTAALFLQRYGGYALWSFLQEFLLLNFFLLRLMRLVPGKQKAAIAATSLFALVHLPNPILTPLTLLWGYTSCLIFLRYRNLYLPALAHAILGITIAITVPGQVDHNMRVGLGYLTYRQHPQRLHVVPAGLEAASPAAPSPATPASAAKVPVTSDPPSLGNR